MSSTNIQQLLFVLYDTKIRTSFISNVKLLLIMSKHGRIDL
ncbi:hypothetical protein DR85_1094 [Francisella tularensis]|nr:hypothetical protein DR85_1094 [Francisella tularensis]